MMKKMTAVIESRGRARPEPDSDLRNPFQRDVDRITHSKSFRRLIHKTQVFLNPESDHYRTRLTHTLKVSRIARTISRALGLNEDLTEAIAIGHDLGHTPFGHAGERALNEILGRTPTDNLQGFSHNEQSLRVVDRIERGGAGLNLTFETRDGILCHTGAKQPDTQEGCVVRLSDRVAYLNHDLDDALRAALLTEDDVPDEVTCAFGTTTSQRIDTIVRDIIDQAWTTGEITVSPERTLAYNAFYAFMYESVYRNPIAKSEESKVLGILEAIFNYFVTHPEEMTEEYRAIAEQEGLRRAVADYVAGMTDSYVITVYERLFVPKGWR